MISKITRKKNAKIVYIETTHCNFIIKLVISQNMCVIIEKLLEFYFTIKCMLEVTL